MPDTQLTIWGRANSVNVQKVLWCLTELGLPISASTPAWLLARPATPTISP